MYAASLLRYELIWIIDLLKVPTENHGESKMKNISLKIRLLLLIYLKDVVWRLISLDE